MLLEALLETMELFWPGLVFKALKVMKLEHGAR